VRVLHALPLPSRSLYFAKSSGSLRLWQAYVCSGASVAVRVSIYAWHRWRRRPKTIARPAKSTTQTSSSASLRKSESPNAAEGTSWVTGRSHLSCIKLITSRDLELSHSRPIAPVSYLQFSYRGPDSKRKLCVVCCKRCCSIVSDSGSGVPGSMRGETSRSLQIRVVL
jgi:hypothetical protein